MTDGTLAVTAASLQFQNPIVLAAGTAGYGVELEGVVDLAGRVRLVGLLGSLAQPEFFREVSVNRETGTVEWPGGVDLDPDVLYAWAHGTTPEALLGLSGENGRGR